MHLIQWNYTREEWNRFQQWKNRRKGRWLAAIHSLLPFLIRKIPGIKIMQGSVYINKNEEPFENASRRLHAVEVREKGSLHLLEISYREGKQIRNISIPVPKGKLREAFEVKARLTNQ